MAELDLPRGWAIASYEDVYLSASNGTGGTQNKEKFGIPVSRIETIAEERIDYARIGFLAEYDREKVERHKLVKGDILFSHINSPIHLGKTAIYDGKHDLYHGINLLRIVVNREVILPEIFNWHCKYTRTSGEFALRAQHAVNQSSLNQKKLGEFEIPLPPLAEQKVIAGKLDTLLAQVDNTKARLERIPEILKSFRQSVLAAAVSGKLTEEWRGTHESESAIEFLKEIEHERIKLINGKKLKKSVLPRIAIKQIESDLPNSWSKVHFEHIAAYDSNALKAGPFGSALKKSDCTSSGFRVYGQEQVIAGDESLVTYYINESKFNELSSCAVKSGDILVSLVGTIGKVLILSDKAEKGIINPRLVKLSLQPEVNRSYIQFYLQSIVALDFFKGFSHGGTMDILNLGILKDLPINFPPLKEQTEIVRRVEELFNIADRIEQAAQAALSRVNNLTQSILAKAFRGELTADWRAANPDLISGDNSAEALLAKIKAERAKVKTRKKD